MPEVHRYERWCSVAATPETFVQAVEAVVSNDRPELREERSRSMEGESWAARVAAVDRAVTEVARRRMSAG